MERGARTVAVVAQKPEPVAKYSEQNQLPFPVLIDRSRDVLRAYGVWHRVGLTAWNIARPALFLIGKDGTILRKYIGQRQDDFPEHDEIMRWLEDGYGRKDENTHRGDAGTRK